MNIRKKFLLSTITLAVILLALTVVSMRRNEAIKTAALEYTDWAGTEEIINQDIVQNLQACRTLYYQFALERNSNIFQKLQVQLEETVEGAERARVASYEYKELSGGIDKVESSAGDLGRFSRDYFSSLQDYRSIKNKGDKLFVDCFLYMKNTENEGLFRITYNVKESVLLQQLAFSKMMDSYTDINIGVYEETAEKTARELAEWQVRIKDNLALNRIINEIQSFTFKIAATVKPAERIVAEMAVADTKLHDLMGSLSGSIASIKEKIIDSQQKLTRSRIAKYSENTEMMVLGIGVLGLAFLVGSSLLVNSRITAGVECIETMLQDIVSGKKTTGVQEWLADKYEFSGIAGLLGRVVNDYAGMSDLFEYCNCQLLGGKRAIVMDSGLLSQKDKYNTLMPALERHKSRQATLVEGIGREVGDLFLGMNNLTAQDEKKALKCIGVINRLLNDLKDAEKITSYNGRRLTKLKDNRPQPKPRPKLLESARFNTKMLAARG